MEHRVNPSSLPPGMPVPRKARHGCIVQVLGALAFGLVVVMAVTAIVAPWAFYMGGNFHVIPQWTGWGRMHSNLAGDYVLYVQISPGRPSRFGRNVPHISGQGHSARPPVNATVCALAEISASLPASISRASQPIFI